MPRKAAATAVLEAPTLMIQTGFVIDRAQFSEAISMAQRAVPPRPSHPVLGNILVEFSQADQRITLTSFDLTIGYCLSLPAEVYQSGAIALPSKLLGDLVSKLPGLSVEMVIDPESFGATLSCQQSRYQIQGMSAEEFTTLPKPSGEAVAVNLSSAAVRAAFGSILYAVSRDETKQILTGAHITIGQDGDGIPLSLETVATDGHRLAKVSLSLEEDQDDMTDSLSATLVGRGCFEIDRILSVTTVPMITLTLDDRSKTAYCTWDDNLLVMRTLEGQYPAYNQLIPQRFDREVIVDRKTLLGALDRISIIADQKSNHIIKLVVDSDPDQQLVISADAQDAGTGTETIGNVNIDGTRIEIGFNVKYLMESLKAIPTAEVSIRSNTATSPVVIEPLGGISATHLVMPVQVRS